jgi:hypothetical protein
MEGQESKTEVEEIKAQKGNCKIPVTAKVAASTMQRRGKGPK